MDSHETRDRLVRLESSQEHQTTLLMSIRETLTVMQSEHRHHCHSDTAMFNRLETRINQAEATAALETVKARNESDARIHEVENQINMAKKFAVFIWTPLTALASAALGWALKK